MDFFKKMIIIAVLISFLGLQFPRECFAEQNQSHAKTAEAIGITRHDPEFLAPPEIDIPAETQAPEKIVKKKKMKKWLWIGLGAVAAGVVAAALDGPSPPTPPSSGGGGTGTIDIVGPAP